MRFEVRALRGDQFETLVLDASDAAEAQLMTVTRQLTPVEVRPLRVRAGATRFDLTLFVQELIELLDAGLELVEAVDALSAREDGGDDGRKVVGQLLARLRDGHSFSGALALAEDIFPPLFIGLVRAAEQTSGLLAALSRYLEYRGRFDLLRQKIAAALIYPAILLSVGGMVSLFLLGFVVPRFAAVYRGGGRDLPLASRLLLQWGEFFSTHVMMFAWLFPALLFLLIVALRRVWNNGQLEAAIQRLPAIGKHVETFRIAQIYLAVGTLINGGMPVLQALTLAEGVAPVRLVPRLHAVSLALRRGVPASAALSSQALVTPVALRLIRAGEGTGKLGEMMLRAARYHDQQLARWIDRVSRIFEPVLMAAIGVVIGLIVVLLYMPIFDLAGSLQ